MAGAAPVTRAVPDGGWGWVVVLASFVLQALTSGVTYTFGIMYVELLDYFQASRSDTAWIGSIQPCLLYFTGIFAAPLMKRFSWRPITIVGSIISAVGFVTSGLVTNIYLLYLTYGLLTGVGSGLMYVTSMVAVQHYFDSKRSLATGLAVSGSGVGTFTFGFVLQLFLNRFGWRWTMAFQGVLMLLGILCGAALRPLPDDLEEEDDKGNSDSGTYEGKEDNKTYQSDTDQKSKSVSYSRSVSVKVIDEPTCCRNRLCVDCRMILAETFDFTLFKNPLFVMFCFSILMFTFGYHVPYTYTPERAVVLGVDHNSASFLVSIMGIANVGSRLFFGCLADKSVRARYWITALTLTMAGILTTLTFLFTTHPMLIVYSVLFGIFAGCFASLYPVVLVDLLGVENFERSIGLALSVRSIGFLFASPLSGWIIDMTNNYDTPFVVVGIMETLGGVVTLVLACIHCTRSRSQYEEITPKRRRKHYLSESIS